MPLLALSCLILGALGCQQAEAPDNQPQSSQAVAALESTESPVAATADYADSPDKSEVESETPPTELIPAKFEPGGEDVSDETLEAALVTEYLPASSGGDSEDFTLPDDPDAPSPPSDAAYASLVNERRNLDQTVWKGEVEAQEHERLFTWLWDRMIFENDRFAPLAEFPVGTFTSRTPREAEELDWEIRLLKPSKETLDVSAADWPGLVRSFQESGYEIESSEWHHLKFNPSEGDAAPSSTVSYSLYVLHRASNRRLHVKGSLNVQWGDERDGEGRPLPAAIDASDYTIAERTGEPVFEIVHSLVLPRDERGQKAPSTPHPVLLYDFNDDGLDEVVIGGHNVLLWNEGGSYRRDVMVSPNGPRHTNAGLIADVDGDARPEYIVGLKSGPLVIYFADEQGRYHSDDRRFVEAVGKLIVPSCISAGDIDRDGDLDLFVAQLRPPYLLGKVPTPFFDANDGFPSYCLLNDGQGNFTDVTTLVGLADKRFRRTFSVTFLDLNEDEHLDLITVSDFSGLDVNLNNGAGGFRDVTEAYRDVRSAFGMSHTFGDYDLNGRLDFYMIGMSSTTARRLDHMGLRREDRAEWAAYADMRQHMGYGNRMFLRGPAGELEQAPFNDDVARTGWSWGSTTFDFDNDSDPDIYVANGQLSGKTTKDYCTRFWCHDIYIGDQRNDAGVAQLIQEISPKLGGGGMSWNGYEHNALFMNRSGEGFINVGFLFGCDLVQDCRTILSNDVDGDGRVDLIVEQQKASAPENVLHFLKNNWPEPADWIGFRLQDEGGDRHAIGVLAKLTLADGTVRVGQHLVGHSVWAQHAPVIHFGLGQGAEVASVELTWPSGRSITLDRPEKNKYHAVAAP